MRNTFPSCLLSSFFIFTAMCFGAELETVKAPPKAEARAIAKFDPFTGKITKNRVRMRLQSSFDGFVVRELNRNDLVLILGETEDFYAIQPPSDMKGYVFRTFILDNVIEGNRVNVRLKPDLESPSVAQLKSGDRVEGNVHPTNNKWMEVKLPQTARFYIAKDYVEKAGDANFKVSFEKKQADLYHLLNTTEALSKAEMQKPFDQMMIEGIKANFQHIVFDNPEFPEAAARAKEGLAALQNDYNAKKMSYLENQTHASSTAFEMNKHLAQELQAHKTKISHLEQQVEKERRFAMQHHPEESTQLPQLPVNMSLWLPIEEQIYNLWTQKNGQATPNDFYEQQKQQGFVLKGVVDSYNRPVKNKPGDYLLLNSTNKLPLAFLYSTHINLQDFIGREISIVVSPRDNHNFAFPAYFVLTVE